MVTFSGLVDAAGYITLSSCILSILGDLFVIVSYRKRTLTSTLPQLVFWLAVADCLGAIAIIVGGHVYEDENTCKIAGGAFFMFFVSSFIWTLFIAVHHYNPDQKSMRWRHLVAWGYALVLTIILESLDRFGRPYPLNTCWFKRNNDPFMWVCFFGTLGSIVCFNMFTYIRILYQRYQRHKEKQLVSVLDTAQPVGRAAATTEAETKTRKLAAYLLIFIICWSPDVVQNIIVVRPNGSQFFATPPGVLLGIMAALLTPLQGFLNSIVYGVTEDMIVFLRYMLCRKRQYSLIVNDSSDGESLTTK